MGVRAVHQNVNYGHGEFVGVLGVPCEEVRSSDSLSANWSRDYWSASKQRLDRLELDPSSVKEGHNHNIGGGVFSGEIVNESADCDAIPAEGETGSSQMRV